MVHTTCNWRASNYLGSKVGWWSLLGILNGNQWWPWKAEEVLFTVWWKACLYHCSWYVFLELQYLKQFPNIDSPVPILQAHLHWGCMGWTSRTRSQMWCREPTCKRLARWGPEDPWRHSTCLFLVDATYLTCIDIADGALLQEPTRYKPNTNSGTPHRWQFNSFRVWLPLPHIAIRPG